MSQLKIYSCLMVRQAKASKGPTEEQVSLMERESANLEREFKIAAKLWP